MLINASNTIEKKLFFSLTQLVIALLVFVDIPAHAQDQSVGNSQIFSSSSLYGSQYAGSMGLYNPMASRASGMSYCTPPSDTSFLQGGKDAPAGLGAYLSPYLGLSEFYTDNIYLAPPRQEQSNSATIISPGLRGCTVGSIFRAKFNYSAEGVWYRHNPPSNSFFNRVNGDFTGQIVPSHLFLDGKTIYGQTAIDPFRAYSTNNAYAIANNRTNIWVSSLSPYWLQNFGALGVGVLRYTYGRVQYSNSSLFDSTSQEGSFVLNSPSYNTKWNWTLGWSTNTIHYDSRNSNEYFDNAYLTLGYQLTHHIRLIATGGVEDNYLPNGEIQRYGSSYWSAGFAWHDLRYALQAEWGHRFFGTSMSVSAQYHMPQFSVGAQYTETPMVEALQAAVIDNNSQSTFTVYSSLVPLNQAQYTNSYLNKRLQINFAYRFAKSNLSLTAYEQHNNYFVNRLGRYRSRGGTATWEWVLSSRSQLAASFQRDSLKQDGATSYIVNYGNLRWTYLITPLTHLTISLARQSSQSAYSYAHYVADSAVLQLITTF